MDREVPVALTRFIPSFVLIEVSLCQVVGAFCQFPCFICCLIGDCICEIICVCDHFDVFRLFCKSGNSEHGCEHREHECSCQKRAKCLFHFCQSFPFKSVYILYKEKEKCQQNIKRKIGTFLPNWRRINSFTRLLCDCCDNAWLILRISDTIPLIMRGKNRDCGLVLVDQCADYTR